MNLFHRPEHVTAEGFRIESYKKNNRYEEAERTVTPFAFNRRVAKEIKGRVHWMCEVTGRKKSDGWRMEASHLDHDHNHPYYGNECNGECLCISEHMRFHIAILSDYRENGTQEQEDWAEASLKLLSRRAYNKGLRTDEHYQERPADIIDDRDEVCEILSDAGLKPEDYIYYDTL